MKGIRRPQQIEQGTRVADPCCVSSEFKTSSYLGPIIRNCKVNKERTILTFVVYGSRVQILIPGHSHGFGLDPKYC